HNRPNDDLRLHPNRNTPIIGRKPHSDVALVEEETLERHDDQHTSCFNFSPWTTDSLNLLNKHVQLSVLLIVVYVHCQRGAGLKRQCTARIIETGDHV